jgi:phosphoribosylaminoimidazole (AIR) synthetase
MLAQSLLSYATDVIWLWDNASEELQEACKTANRKTSVAPYFRNSGGYELKQWVAVKESIDGVWTKWQIYCEAFEWYYKEYEQWKITRAELVTIWTDLWERELHDLIAMNTDDLRNGEMAVAVTNIIDINHLKWEERGPIFVESMAQAMHNVIIDLDIMITAWETAILWEPKKVWEIIEAIDEILSDIENRTIVWLLSSPFIKMFRKWIKSKLDNIMPKIEFNAGGTSLWITDGTEKLTNIKEGHAIIILEETPHNWIIGPRSNGITAIRDQLTKLAWRWWENLTYEEFMALPNVASRDSWRINANVHADCKWKKMWEIATGKTTVFNPFVSRVLLWWVKIPEDTNVVPLFEWKTTQPWYTWEPQVQLSSITHVTWNPGGKMLTWFQWHSAVIWNRPIKEPHIISLLGFLNGISTKDKMKQWNCNMPYAITCPISEVETIVELARENWFTWEQRWIIWKHEWKNATVTMYDQLDDSTIIIKNKEAA